MFKKIENKIKEIAIKINKSKVLDWEETYNDAKEIFELAVIYKYLSKSKRNSDWVFYSEKLKETLRQLDLSSEKNDELTNNESEIIPLIDSIKDLASSAFATQQRLEKALREFFLKSVTCDICLQ